MQLQKDPMSMTKPTNLPNMEIIKDKANQSDRIKFPPGGHTNKDWMPTYVKPTMSKVSNLVACVHGFKCWKITKYKSSHTSIFFSV